MVSHTDKSIAERSSLSLCHKISLDNLLLVDLAHGITLDRVDNLEDRGDFVCCHVFFEVFTECRKIESARGRLVRW